MIASRMRDELDSSSSAQAIHGASELGRNNTNLKTWQFYPVSRSVPVDAFARKLQAALEGMGASTSYLNQASVSGHLGVMPSREWESSKLRAGWQIRSKDNQTVLYVADSPVSSSWTQTCIRQVRFCDYYRDRYFLIFSDRQIASWVVGMGDDPGIGEYERLLLSMKTTARKELVLLHPHRSCCFQAQLVNGSR